MPKQAQMLTICSFDFRGFIYPQSKKKKKKGIPNCYPVRVIIETRIFGWVKREDENFRFNKERKYTSANFRQFYGISTLVGLFYVIFRVLFRARVFVCFVSWLGFFFTPTWTQTKHIGGKCATLNKSWEQHLTKQYLHSHLPPILQTIPKRWIWHAGHYR